MASPILPLIGNRYRLEERLGVGGMGTVYRASDCLSSQQVALNHVTTESDQIMFASRSIDADVNLACKSPAPIGLA